VQPVVVAAEERFQRGAVAVPCVPDQRDVVAVVGDGAERSDGVRW
jgi:hypothetical protein